MNEDHEYATQLKNILVQVGFLESRGKDNEYRITPDGQSAYNALSWYIPCDCGDKNCRD